MSNNFFVRMIDLTLLLLLSLLSIARISDIEVVLPVSQEMSDQGTIPWPIKAAVTADGVLFIEGYGQGTPEDVVRLSAADDRPVELRVDANADALLLLRIHQVLEQADRPSAFIVEHTSR